VSEFIQIQVPGLVALYCKETDVVKSQTPIVGYLKDEAGKIVAAIAGHGAEIVPANSVKGYRGLKWIVEPMQTHVTQKTVTSEASWDGVSTFERIFGKGIFGGH
jgi:hypothetical protein